MSLKIMMYTDLRITFSDNISPIKSCVFFQLFRASDLRFSNDLIGQTGLQKGLELLVIQCVSLRQYIQ